MNKLLIVLLAVCLVSVHGFVKRDAPADTASTGLADIQKSLTDLGNTIQEKLKENLNPDKIKDDFNKAIDEIKKQVEKFSTPENKS